MNMQQPLIEAPALDNYRAVQTLGYLDAYDAVLNDDYAFVAFKETDKSSGSYEIKIKSRGTAGAAFEPAMIRAKCREACAQNQPYFTWGVLVRTFGKRPAPHRISRSSTEPRARR